MKVEELMKLLELLSPDMDIFTEYDGNYYPVKGIGYIMVDNDDPMTGYKKVSAYVIE